MKLASRPTVVDLFAGAGVFSHAFDREGFRVLRAVELDRNAAATYAANLGNHVVVGDVRRLDPEGTCDVLIAGPPCQGFSTLGKRRGDDPRNRLSYEVVRWAKAMRPSVIVIENVTAFLTSPQWRVVTSRLRALGYQTASMVLDAAEFGAAQRRRRSFTFAYLDRLETPRRARGRKTRTVRDAIGHLPLVPDGVNHHVAPVPSALARARIEVIPAGGDKRDVMRQAPGLAPRSWWRSRVEITDVWGRMSWDRPCNTLRTALLNPSKGRYIHPEAHRVISLREAACLQTIPDSWRFVGTPWQIARQIGNSVPPALGRAVARAVRQSIN